MTQSTMSSRTDLILQNVILSLFLFFALILFTTPGKAQNPGADNHYTVAEIVDTGHKFFGKVSGGLAAVIEKAVSKHGLPNGYILGEEGSAALVAGARYGEGSLYTKNMGSHKAYWQGPSIGWDFGGDGNRTMMLVYNLPSVDFLYRRWGGVNGSAYLVGGFGLTMLTAGNPYYVVPIRSGVGARLGINIGYLKFSRKPTWNPF
ncbi:DUF1134 domain-containing protein [uncultured Cohaesibacter sp.]|uniref:DUF1134 domain-containing protein n=1 Tax=uncultured Cohaesibacter sp. TaxID=1002546 RepID=UPI00292F8674|nr:DUF1134 domain-containing protein [uncultured Cohaesibacter sp.]